MNIGNSSGIRSGIWQGQDGSRLHLKVDGHGVSGHFQTVHGSPDFSEKFGVTGFTDGEFIGFVVLWRGHDSITSWTGRHTLDERGEHIRTMWHLGRKYRDNKKTQATKDWDCILSNSSQFYYKGPLEN